MYDAPVYIINNTLNASVYTFAFMGWNAEVANGGWQLYWKSTQQKLCVSWVGTEFAHTAFNKRLSGYCEQQR